MIADKKLRRLSIRQITWIVTILVSGSAFALGHIFAGTSKWIWRLTWILVFVGINFWIVMFFIEKYLFHKIKIIYKLITDVKKDKSIKDISSESLQNVNEDVVEWAQNTSQEIASLKSLEEYRKNYVGNISHELKTPIFSIQAYLHTLLDGGINDPKINIDFLKRASDNVERLQNIVEDLEVITKLESGQVSLELTKFDIKDLVINVINDLQSIADKKMISIRFKDNSQLTYIVHADKNAVRQVINNLIVNSIKYGRDGGITKLAFYDLDNEILVEISDNGIGIEEKHLKHLFDRFYRVDSSRSRKQGGSGLGLSIVKHIIEAHGQTINVRSTVEEGSTFGFTLKKG